MTCSGLRRPQGEATTEPAATTPLPASDKALAESACKEWRWWPSALVRDDRSGTVSRLDRLDLDLGQLTPKVGTGDPWRPRGPGELAFDLKGRPSSNRPGGHEERAKDLNLSGKPEPAGAAARCLHPSRPIGWHWGVEQSEP